MDNFKRRVLESSIRDINENTKFKVEYENVKEGRKIVAFNFKLHLPAELKKEKRKKQIVDVLQLAKDTVKPMTEEKPTISDEQRARNQERLKELMGSIKGM
jgi:plasmid replication initiation protein